LSWYVQDGTVKLWNYRQGEILDDVDCFAYINFSGEAAAAAGSSNANVSSRSHPKFKDIRCMACCRRMLAVSFNG